jgi:predicted RNase H-like nuclease (RuvC/YqgF family)
MSKPFDRYTAYVGKLEVEGRKFPVNPANGEVNWTKVAEDSKTRRQWYYDSRNKVFGPEKKTLEAILKADIKRIGTDITAPKDPDEELSKIADNRSREASQLRQMLEQKSKENELLRSDLQKFKEENRVLKNRLSEVEGSTEEMLDSGRCFSL